jgi:hypothetical protein
MSATVGGTQKVRAVVVGALDEVRGSPAAHACWQHYIIHLLLGRGMASYGLPGTGSVPNTACLRAIPTLSLVGFTSSR